MSPVNFLLLVILAAVWGASFLFIRGGERKAAMLTWAAAKAEGRSPAAA